jgi:hypothetical protein
MFKKYYFSLIIFFYSVSELSARIGGGQGHGRSSGGSYGRGGDGVDIGWIIYLVMQYPAIGIPVLIVAVVMFYKGGGAANAMHQQSTISRYSHTAQANSFNQGLEKLKITDPEFDENIFGDRVRKTFTNLQKYWSSGEINKIRPFVSDGLYESFSILHERYRHYGMRNDMQGLNIHSCTPIDVETSEHYHTITYKIRATAIDSMRDLESDKFIGGSKLSESFTEYWSFIRKPGTLTLNKPGLLEGNCPNCASPLEMMDKTSCPYCHAVICSGEYDWLLVEISQSDWKPEGNKKIPGVHDISSIDSGFNRQAIEDRVSTAFWNVRRAEFEASSKKLSKYAQPDLINTLNEKFKSEPGKYYADPAVGTVELLNVQKNDQGLDRAYAKICWSGHTEIRSEKRPIPDYYKSTMINQVYVFERQYGVLTEAETSLNSAHCPGCGAPASDQTHGSCEYCGTPFNDGSKDWVLTAIMPFAAYRSTVKVGAVEKQGTSVSSGVSSSETSSLDKEQLMAVVIESMLDDGVIDQAEQAVLMEFLQHMNMSVEHINQLMNGISDGSYAVLTPTKPIDRKELLGGIIKLCLLDSSISKTERKVLESISTKFGYGHTDLKMLIKKQRGKLYKESKIYLKTNK